MADGYLNLMGEGTAVGRIKRMMEDPGPSDGMAFLVQTTVLPFSFAFKRNFIVSALKRFPVGENTYYPDYLLETPISWRKLLMLNHEGVAVDVFINSDRYGTEPPPEKVDELKKACHTLKWERDL